VNEGLERIAQRAKAEPGCRFTALAHHLTEDFLRDTWHRLNRRGAAGVDGVAMAAYEKDLDEHIRKLVAGLKQRRYRAPSVRRVHIPKAGNPKKLRPLGIPTVEDRMLQAAVARILSAIYEADFLECSYGFRPGRRAHDALRVVRQEVMTGRADWVVEADIRGFFDNIDHGWMLRMLGLRIGDPWILRLIQKWLKAGIFEGGQVTTPERGTPQGGPVSPVLANVYLHYALDLWVERVVRPRCQGPVTLVRFADDFVILCKRERDARVIAAALPQRLRKFGLALAEEKTRVVPFGRVHWWNGRHRGHHFDFLGFRHHLGTSRKGRMTIIRLPSPKSTRRFLMETKRWLAEHMHDRPEEQQRMLAVKLTGFYEYFSVWNAGSKLRAVQREVLKYWQRTLRRRSQRGKCSWTELRGKRWFTLPTPKLVHGDV
jgi:RNA-directed DNA polymerase